MKLTAWLFALIITPLLVRVGSSGFLTYKYEHFVRANLNPTTAAADTGLTRADVDRALRPLGSEAVSANLPLIFMDEKERAGAYVQRYYLTRRWLAGCYLYMAFDGPKEGSKLIGHRDTCE